MADNYEMFNLVFDDLFLNYDLDEEEKEKKKDFCYDCNTSELYTHAMTFKCSKCHKIILGGIE